MKWYRLYSAGESIGAEAIEEPVFVYRQANGVIDICNEAHAQGVVSADESTYYQLAGRDSLGNGYAVTAEEISGTEYDEIVRELPDPEDTEPEVTKQGKYIMTREELTDALLLLLSGVTE